MLTFYKMYPSTHNPIRADKAALGHVPLVAFRYCEPVRVASGYGWYVFPPVDIKLRFNGVDTFYEDHGVWRPLQEAYLPGYIEFWNKNCPENFRGLVPPFLRTLNTQRGVVQIWSGLLVESESGWACNIRGLANCFRTNAYRHYEGIVETDIHAPCPLFINLQLISTDTEILLSKDEPLFQVQPIQKSSYAGVVEANVRSGMPSDTDDDMVMSSGDWERYRRTFRADVEGESHLTGDYAREVRRKAGPENS